MLRTIIELNPKREKDIQDNTILSVGETHTSVSGNRKDILYALYRIFAIIINHKIFRAETLHKLINEVNDNISQDRCIICNNKLGEDFSFCSKCGAAVIKEEVINGK